MSDKNLENIILDKDEKVIKPKKLNFFKKAWYSVTKFDKYIEMSLEGTGRALKYLIQIISIFVLIIACVGIYNINGKLNEFVINIQENAPDFTYANGKIELAETQEKKVYTINDTSLNFGKIIIDLETEDENIISEYEETIKNASETNNMGIIMLKDEVVQVAQLVEGVEGESTVSITYEEVVKALFGTTEVEVTKSNLIEYLNGNGRTSIFIVNFFAYFIAYFIIYFSSGLIYALILGIIGFASAKLTKLKLTFLQLFNISIYAFTLSNILNIIYFLVNYFTGITIKYFDVAYIAIAYVYLVAVLFLIKTDMLKKQEKENKKENKEEKEETNGQEQI